MKRVLYILIITASVLSFNCRKKLDQFGLPPATQKGKHTFGFLVNGKPWMPKGNAGGISSKLNIAFGNGTDLRGTVTIGANRLISDTDREYIGLGMWDSVFVLKPPFTIPLTNTGIYRIYYTSNDCSYYSHDTNTQVSGGLTITKHDRTKGIFSGTFTANFSKQGCATINITEGRFDMGTR